MPPFQCSYGAWRPCFQGSLRSGPLWHLRRTFARTCLRRPEGHYYFVSHLPCGRMLTGPQRLCPIRPYFARPRTPLSIRPASCVKPDDGTLMFCRPAAFRRTTWSLVLAYDQVPAKGATSLHLETRGLLRSAAFSQRLREKRTQIPKTSR